MVFWLVRSCLLITLITCLKGQKSLRVLYGSVFQQWHGSWRLSATKFLAVIWRFLVVSVCSWRLSVSDRWTYRAVLGQLKNWSNIRIYSGNIRRPQGPRLLSTFLSNFLKKQKSERGAGARGGRVVGILVWTNPTASVQKNYFCVKLYLEGGQKCDKWSGWCGQMGKKASFYCPHMSFHSTATLPTGFQLDHHQQLWINKLIQLLSLIILPRKYAMPHSSSKDTKMEWNRQDHFIITISKSLIWAILMSHF